MKKLFTLFTLIFVLNVANAQRSCDLRSSQYLPMYNQEIQSGKPFDITCKVKNLGPAAVKVTDTIAYYLALDGSYLMSGGKPLGKAFFGLAIAVGDEVTMPLFAGLTFTHNLQGTHPFCTEVLLFNRSAADAATDPVATNNLGCSNVLMNMFSVGLDPNNITSVLVNSISASPNPAVNSTTLNYILSENNAVKIVIKDIQGREVLTVINEDEKAGIYQNTLDLSTLSTGIYMVEYRVGNNIITTKLVKQ